MGWRNITVDGDLYRWRVGRSYVQIRGGGIRDTFTCGAVKGLTPDLFDRGKWKQTSDGMIMPSDVSRFIRGQQKQ